ncbi:MAG: hypothetical protein LUP97_01490 [Methanoregula sp.]|nr:hypothetical protein [Methanoregula sp.]
MISLAGIPSPGVIALILPGAVQTSSILIIAIINRVLMILVGCSLSDPWKSRAIVICSGCRSYS